MKRIIQFKRKISSSKKIFTWERTSTQEINSFYGIDAESELTKILTEEILKNNSITLSDYNNNISFQTLYV